MKGRLEMRVTEERESQCAGCKGLNSVQCLRTFSCELTLKDPANEFQGPLKTEWLQAPWKTKGSC